MSGSSKAVSASWFVIPCLRRLLCLLASSHSNFVIICIPFSHHHIFCPWLASSPIHLTIHYIYLEIIQTIMKIFLKMLVISICGLVTSGCCKYISSSLTISFRNFQPSQAYTTKIIRHSAVPMPDSIHVLGANNAFVTELAHGRNDTYEVIDTVLGLDHIIKVGSWIVLPNSCGKQNCTITVDNGQPDNENFTHHMEF